MPSATTTSVWNGPHRSRSSRAGMAVSTNVDLFSFKYFTHRPITRSSPKESSRFFWGRRRARGVQCGRGLEPIPLTTATRFSASASHQSQISYRCRCVQGCSTASRFPIMGGAPLCFSSSQQWSKSIARTVGTGASSLAYWWRLRPGRFKLSASCEDQDTIEYVTE